MTVLVLFVILLYCLLSIKGNRSSTLNISDGDTDDGSFVRSDPFYHAFNSHDRIVKNLDILEYSGNYRSSGVGTFHLHDHVLHLNEHIDKIHSFSSQGIYSAYIHENVNHDFKEGSIIVGTSHTMKPSIKRSILNIGGKKLLRIHENDNHEDGVIFSHRVVKVNKYNVNGGKDELILEPVHPMESFKTIDLSLNITRVLRSSIDSLVNKINLSKNTQIKKEDLRIDHRNKIVYIDAEASDSGGGTPGTIQLCNPAKCASCSAYSDGYNSYCNKVTGDTSGNKWDYAWCWSTAGVEACVEYEYHVPLLNMNYDTSNQAATESEKVIEGVDGFICKDCYAYLGGGVGVEAHYDQNRVWEFSAHLWGQSKMNLDLQIKDPTITAPLDVTKTIIQGQKMQLFTYGYITVDYTPKLTARVRTNGEVSLKGQFTAQSKLDAEFNLGLEESSPYLFTSSNFQFDAPKVTLTDFTLTSSSASFSVDLRGEGPLEATVGSSALGLVITNDIGLGNKLSFNDDSSSGRRLSDVIQLDDEEITSIEDVTIGDSVIIKLNDFIKVYEADYDSVQRQTKLLDISINNPACIGEHVALPLKTSLINVPLYNNEFDLEINIPHNIIFQNCYDTIARKQYSIQVRNIGGEVLYKSKEFQISNLPNTKALVKSSLFENSKNVELTWTPNILQSPQARSIDNYQEVTSLVPTHMHIVIQEVNLTTPNGNYFSIMKNSKSILSDDETNNFLNSGKVTISLSSQLIDIDHSKTWKLFLLSEDNPRIAVAVTLFKLSTTGEVIIINSHSNDHESSKELIQPRLQVLGASSVRRIQHTLNDRRSLSTAENCLNVGTHSQGFGDYKKTDFKFASSTTNLHTSTASVPFTIDVAKAKDMGSTCEETSVAATPTAKPTAKVTVSESTDETILIEQKFVASNISVLNQFLKDPIGTSPGTEGISVSLKDDFLTVFKKVICDAVGVSVDAFNFKRAIVVATNARRLIISYRRQLQASENQLIIEYELTHSDKDQALNDIKTLTSGDTLKTNIQNNSNNYNFTGVTVQEASEIQDESDSSESSDTTPVIAGAVVGALAIIGIGGYLYMNPQYLPNSKNSAAKVAVVKEIETA